MNNKERRAQTKRRFDTHRIASEPTEEDYKMEQMYFLHFIGLKSPLSEFSYNKFVPINIDLCDIFADVSDKSDDETVSDLWNEDVEDDADSRLPDNLDSMSVNDSDSDDFDLFWDFIPRQRLVDYDSSEDNPHHMRWNIDSDEEDSLGSI
jgi:hypothetical protein